MQAMVNKLKSFHSLNYFYIKIMYIIIITYVILFLYINTRSYICMGVCMLGLRQMSESEMLQRAIQMSTQDYIEDQKRKFFCGK